jgi:hypothetical protein
MRTEAWRKIWDMEDTEDEDDIEAEEVCVFHCVFSTFSNL